MHRKTLPSSMNCSFCSDPSLIHFSSPTNLLHCKQINIWLACLLSRSPLKDEHNGYCGHRSTTGFECHIGPWEPKSMLENLCPIHLWTAHRLVLPVCLAASARQLPGHNRWLHTETQNNYKRLLPFCDKTRHTSWRVGCRIVLYSGMLRTRLQ